MNAPKGEETIFAAALRLPPMERAAYLAQSTAGNAGLRERVESLLGSYESGDFLEEAAASQMRQTLQVTVPLTEKPGDTIGRYKLLQQIGEGGCGVVYMAEQAEPVRRRVALKIIKLGLDTKSVIARFEAERQALAMMDHPCIAKVLDAGATETGRPYFVMELVRGMKITDYCDEKQLTTRERLDLFIQVCHAIQHAHQKGIIHRDIKPSNILVTVNDGAPVPKVIDFGIAKATSGQQLTDKTLFTAFEQFIGTPAYMSPEQAVLTSLDIDTRSDIYALGVLLYEMLTGRTPFDAQELLAIGLDEMRRTIREQEPPRPSTRLSTLPGQELSTTAQRRGLDAPKLVSELRGDLDWIVMRALEKDRARRYETASGLASDIQRHLKNEPVVACPPGRGYRFQKMVRRNKLAFAAGSAVAASLVIGLTFSTVLFFRERAARNRANEQTAIAEAVNDFLQDDLLQQATSFSQAEAHFTPDPNLTVREALDRAASRIGDRFKDQPLQEAAVRHTIGYALIGVGESERAIDHLQRAWDARRAILRPDHPDTLKSMLYLAMAYGRGGNFGRALPLLKDALRLSMAGLGPDHLVTLDSMSRLAEGYRVTGRLDEAVPLFEETLKLRKARLGPDHRETLSSMADLAGAYSDAGRLDQALTLAEETLKLSKATLAPDHPTAMRSMNLLADCYLDLDKLDEAVSLYEETLNLQKARLGPDDTSTLWSMHNLSIAHSRAGKNDQALELLEEAVKRGKARPGPDHPDTLHWMVTLVGTYRGAGRLSQAVALGEETLKLTKAKLGPDHRNTLGAMNNLALAYEDAGKSDMALSLFEEGLKLRRAKFEPDDPDTLGAMNNLAMAYRARGKLDLALTLFEQTLKLRKARLGPKHRDTIQSMDNLAFVYRKAGKLNQLEALYRERLAQESPDNLNAKIGLGRLLLEAAKTNSTDSRRPEELAREGEELVRGYLTDVRSRYTNDPAKLTEKLYDAAELDYRQGNYVEAEPLYREIVQGRRSRLRADHKDVLEPTASLARVLSDWAWAERDSHSAAVSERASEAERLLREVLAVRLRDSADSWRTGDVKSRLGGALVSVVVMAPGVAAEDREAKLSEAESLLVEGCERVQSGAPDDKWKRDALQRLVRLYGAWNKPDQRAEWQQKLELFENAPAKLPVPEGDAAATATK